jgi:beta-glucosidase
VANKNIRQVMKSGGEQQTVTFRLPANQLAFVDADCHWRLEEGDFILRVGRLSQTVTCTKSKIWSTPNM